MGGEVGSRESCSETGVSTTTQEPEVMDGGAKGFQTRGRTGAGAGAGLVPVSADSSVVVTVEKAVTKATGQDRRGEYKRCPA